jgi:peptidoglycan/LPS O-acetylase OafA/YrhL
MAITHDNNFNFIRLVLTILVLLAHAPELIDGDRHRELLTNIFHTLSFGELAVNGFFLLSGYLILQSWQRQPQLGNFLKKRILRIYPGFLIASLVSISIVTPLAIHPIDFFRHIDVIGHLQDLLFLTPPSAPPNIFQGQPYPKVNGSLWTIFHEFRCYLLVAIVGVLGGLKRSTTWLVLSAFVFIGHNLPLAVCFPQLPEELAHQVGDLIRLLTFFCAGGCFYLLRERIHYIKNRALLALGIVTISLFNHSMLQLTLPTLGGYVFFWFAFLKIPILKQFGTASDVSYGIYLYGWPTEKLLIWYLPSLSPSVIFICAVCITYVCGFISWHLVEKPCLQLRNRA